MQTITFSDANDIVVSASIDGVQLMLRFTWNRVGGFWTMHIWDKDENPILCNIRMTPNFPLLFNKHCFAGVPEGEFILLSKEEPDRNSFVEGRATLVYMTREEWES